MPTPPRPVGAYVGAVVAGNLVFVAGHGPRRPDGGHLTGKVPTEGKHRGGGRGRPPLRAEHSFERQGGDRGPRPGGAFRQGSRHGERGAGLQASSESHRRILDVDDRNFRGAGSLRAFGGRHEFVALPDTGRNRGRDRPQELIADVLASGCFVAPTSQRSREARLGRIGHGREDHGRPVRSSSSIERGQSFLSRRDSARSARSLPPVWQRGQ